MNAVNLIPRESRSRREITSLSPPTLALMGGLVVALVAAVLYVMAANTVTTRKGELTQVTAGVAGWTAAANSYASFVQTAQRRTQALADVRQLASSRFPWSGLLGQIGRLMPRAAALSTLQATSSDSATSSTSAPSGASVPAVGLTGCAASQSVVAQTMVQLHRVTGVSDVTLSSSTDSSAASSSSGSSSSSGASGACPFPVQFQVSLTFAPSSTAATATSGTGTTASTTTTTPSTAASTTPTPVAAQ